MNTENNYRGGETVMRKKLLCPRFFNKYHTFLFKKTKSTS